MQGLFDLQSCRTNCCKRRLMRIVKIYLLVQGPISSLQFNGTEGLKWEDLESDFAAG